MKSRFDALTRAEDRRSLALFRSSGAGVVILCLLTLNAIHPAAGGATEAARGDLFALEIGVPQAIRTTAPTIASKHEAARAEAARLSAVTDDELAFSSHYPFEPGSF